ncbi:hypothetical protein GCM10010399_44240 [Dactylosporangium fulvum]|uniref:Uncharacterized protein n=1 Tax=Dactylosporangium fulvum TaxID=53359 RepID=A0ABY5W7B0_9ACTN|nr:hypothetical protein [Dactylosporangium fulvum]UWP85908.1 hypothetical protein Dfulv_17315 [Dactylosporangium fulvum]
MRSKPTSAASADPVPYRLVDAIKAAHREQHAHEQRRLNPHDCTGGAL